MGEKLSLERRPDDGAMDFRINGFSVMSCCALKVVSRVEKTDRPMGRASAERSPSLGGSISLIRFCHAAVLGTVLMLLPLPVRAVSSATNMLPAPFKLGSRTNLPPAF